MPKKCIHTLRDVNYVLLFEVELNYGRMCSRTFTQKMALIKWMLVSQCDRQDSQRKWRKHGCHSRSARPFWSGIWNSRTLWKYNDNGGVSVQLNLQHAQQLHAFVISLRHMVLCVMCTRENPGGLAQQQVLLLLLRCWNSLHACHRSLPNNGHVETEVSRTSIWHILKTARWKVFIPRLLHTLNEDDLTERCSIVSGSKTWYERMRSLWGKWFGLMKHNLNWTEQWTDIIVCIGLQKIHMFMWKKKSIYQASTSGVDCH